MSKDKTNREEAARQMKALNHPLRRKIVGVFLSPSNGRPLSPREVAKGLDQPLSNVSYHVRVLAEFEALDLVRTEPVRGSVEHFYRASQKFISSPMVALVLGLDEAPQRA